MMDINTIMTILIPALVQVESGGRNLPGGDRDSVGVLQIRKIVVDDINARMLLPYEPKWTYFDRRDEHNSKMMCARYLMFYGKRYERLTGKKATLEVLARIQNGGPDGWKKKATAKYWQKVEVELKKQEAGYFMRGK